MMRSIVLLSALLIAGCNCHGPEDCGDPPSQHGHGHPEMGSRGDSFERCVGLDRPDAAVAADVTPSDATSVNGGCRLDRDCAIAGVGLVCEVRSGACVTPLQCSTDAACATGQRCLAGRCLEASAVCQFATDCGAGRDCVDGRCLAACGARTTCGATQTCVAGYCDRPAQAGSQCVRAADCAAGSVCADGRCVAGCNAAHACATAEVCVLGFCQVDTAPRSFCVRDADCASGSVCRRGSCRAACPAGTTAECLRVDVAFDTCGSDLLCTNPLELRPDCARSTDCTAPTVCINARCR